MQKLKSIAIIIIISGAVLSLMPILFYYSNFGEKLIATDQNVWGAFGDFIGGTINPIIGLANLALLAAISFYVAKLDNHKQFNEYRYYAYTEIGKQFEKTSKTSDDYESLKNYIEVFSSNNQFLFPGVSNKVFTELSSRLVATISELYKIKLDEEEKIESGDIQIVPIPKNLGKRFAEALDGLPQTESVEFKKFKEFDLAKKDMIGFIQAVMIEGDFLKYQSRKKSAIENGIENK